MGVMRMFYKVVKEIVLSNSLLIDKSSQIRRMDVGEVMEVLQGPMLDPSVGVYRIRGQALKDDETGWVTVSGNQGITFLLPGGNVLKVLDWTRTSRSPLGLTRIKGRVQGDGAVGWATFSGTNGTKYLEPI